MNKGTDLIIPWDQVNQLMVSRLAVDILELKSATALSVNELALVDRLCFELSCEAQVMFPYQVTSFPVGWGRASAGGIQMRFEEAHHAVMFKLSLVTK